ncbi:MAG: nucleotidyltransferase domain-containing protein [Bacteroidetes bacterium]|nr:nucleotidyltransferase domain-containing protein [Bacteroidota bacterium]
MRLKPDMAAYFKSASAQFSSRSEVWLFGSRVDDTKKGGDIDLLILSEEKIASPEISKFYWKFQQLFGEQKLDIVNYTFTENVNFKALILTNAVKL